jgi:hypothetical protein
MMRLMALAKMIEVQHSGQRYLPILRVNDTEIRDQVHRSQTLIDASARLSSSAKLAVATSMSTKRVPKRSAGGGGGRGRSGGGRGGSRW